MMVRHMVDAGSALAVMGNHDFNAIAWYLPDPANPGDYLRPRFPAKTAKGTGSNTQSFLTRWKTVLLCTRKSSIGC